MTTFTAQAQILANREKQAALPQYSEVYALLTKPAIQVWTEACQEATSRDTTVRGIIDGRIGFINLATARPADKREGCIIKITTTAGAQEKTLEALRNVPGVHTASATFQALLDLKL